MNRIVGTVIAVVAGVSLAVAALLGMSAAHDETADSERLDVDAYCRHEHGGQSTAVRAVGAGGWQCSAWRNGVWGLDDVDLDDACVWQRGDGAHHEPADGADAEPTCVT